MKTRTKVGLGIVAASAAVVAYFLLKAPETPYLDAFEGLALGTAESEVERVAASLPPRPDVVPLHVESTRWEGELDGVAHRRSAEGKDAAAASDPEKALFLRMASAKQAGGLRQVAARTFVFTFRDPETGGPLGTAKVLDGGTEELTFVIDREGRLVEKRYAAYRVEPMWFHRLKWLSPF